MEQLRSDMESLMTELTDLGRRNDELMTAKEADLTVIRDLDNQLKEYKRRYEQAKTELRSVKGSCRFFYWFDLLLDNFIQPLHNYLHNRIKWMTSSRWPKVEVSSTFILQPSFPPLIASWRPADHLRLLVFFCP